ncbi:MAG: UDP-glucose--hexose-1-phosphate uridylyltransferase [Candidatus Acidiferrum sp.]
MAKFNLKSHPHRRLNPLNGQWILVSPNRTQRPWQGQTEAAASERLPTYDPRCYLCPGNERAGGGRNPQYTGTFVFENDYAALQPDTPEGHVREKGLLVAESERGRCRVVCFSPRHDLTLARMEVVDIKRIVDVWAEESSVLSSQPHVQSVQIFENRGAMMGCSNPHPHGQIWANQSVPDYLAVEIDSFQRYWENYKSGLLEDYLAIELEKKERIVVTNDHFAVVVPFWAVWPFETMLLSRRRVARLSEFNDAERTALADIVHQLTVRYDNLFNTSFPYTMGLHQATTAHGNESGFCFHGHFFPPLLRSPVIRKFMVGYEMLAMPQRDITPESAAEQLKQLSSLHYLRAK